MSDPSRVHYDRRVWHPQPPTASDPVTGPEATPPASAEGAAHGSAPATHHNAENRSADIRVLTPTQDAATAALSHELVAIAERALGERIKAEQIVAGLFRMQAALVTTATQSAMANQREAARAALERLVRRAALDALPPVLVDQPKGPASRKAAPPPAGKIAPTAAVQAATLEPAPPPAAPFDTPAVDRPATPPAFEPANRPAGRRPAIQPAGLADLPARAAFEPAAEPRGRPATPRGVATLRGTNPRPRQGLALALVASVVALGGAGLAYFAWQPTDTPGTEQLADLPDLPQSPTATAPSTTTSAPAAPGPAADSPTPQAFPPDDPAFAETMQLEAVEPAAGPLREQAGDDAALNGQATTTPPPAALTGTGLRVVIHHQTGALPAALADDLARRLAESIDPLTVELRTVDFPVAAPRIRYFYDQDADAASALASFLDPPTANGWLLQNFTHFRPGPTAGTLEIFIPGTGG